ncbi:MAG: alpha/beta fold hydrolase [Nitriliruptorales bacterium]
MWTEVEGQRFHARVPIQQPSKGPDVVLVHGFGVSSRTMAPTAQAWAPHCRVYAPDLPGHGLSYKPPPALDPTGLAEALAQWMTAVGLQHACLLGNSYGCQIIVEFALRHPERIERLILQAPTVDPNGRDLPRQLARRLLSGWRERNEPADDETAKDWREMGLRQMVKDARYALRDPIEEKLPHIQAPTLVVRGSRDPIVPQRWAEEATTLLPRGQLVVLPDAIHTITSTRPDQLVEAILPFLKEGTDEDKQSAHGNGGR